MAEISFEPKPVDAQTLGCELSVNGMIRSLTWAMTFVAMFLGALLMSYDLAVIGSHLSIALSGGRPLSAIPTDCSLLAAGLIFSGMGWIVYQVLRRYRDLTAEKIELVLETPIVGIHGSPMSPMTRFRVSVSIRFVVSRLNIGRVRSEIHEICEAGAETVAREGLLMAKVTYRRLAERKLVAAIQKRMGNRWVEDVYIVHADWDRASS